MFGTHSRRPEAAVHPIDWTVQPATLAQRTGRTIEWDAKAMKVKGQPDLDALINEPALNGFNYGEDLW